MNFYIPAERYDPPPAPPQMVIKGPDLTAHIILTIVTLGLWLPILIIAAIVGKRTITYKTP